MGVYSPVRQRNPAATTGGLPQRDTPFRTQRHLGTGESAPGSRLTISSLHLNPNIIPGNTCRRNGRVFTCASAQPGRHDRRSPPAGHSLSDAATISPSPPLRNRRIRPRVSPNNQFITPQPQYNSGQHLPAEWACIHLCVSATRPPRPEVSPSGTLPFGVRQRNPAATTGGLPQRDTPFRTQRQSLLIFRFHANDSFYIKNM
ncbi:hypothetical protein QE152_g41319 [Popillia japonica]|uniref:Uncharacterized protein n=1 Tax=Popillia japonica TaxID=7064 RepID=A0AAW1GUQ7_POPJA